MASLRPIKENYVPNERLTADDFNKVAKVVNKGYTLFCNTFAQALSIVPDLKQGDWVRVSVDETNNSDKTMYLFDGTALEYQYTILTSAIIT